MDEDRNHFKQEIVLIKTWLRAAEGQTNITGSSPKQQQFGSPHLIPIISLYLMFWKYKLQNIFCPLRLWSFSYLLPFKND